MDLAAPPTCPITGAQVTGPATLSAEGWARLQFIDDPACARCATPFSVHRGDGAVCGACAASPPAYDRARAGLVYDEASEALVIRFKHSDRLDLAPLLARIAARAGADLAAPGALLTPVPLHWRRLFKRRYNQSAVLARLTARELNLGCSMRLVQRQRNTRPQQQLSADARNRNVAGAFRVPERALSLVKDTHIIVVDDVLTTGATLSAVARALKRAGAARVDALVVARVANSTSVAI